MLRTKIHRPPQSLEHVFRFRLIDELNKNTYKPFSLICVPAGYGKSMLASSWIEESKNPQLKNNNLELFISKIFNSIIGNLAVIDNEAKIVMANQAWLELFGYTTELNVVGKLITDFIAPEERRYFEDIESIRHTDDKYYHQRKFNCQIANIWMYLTT